MSDLLIKQLDVARTHNLLSYTVEQQSWRNLITVEFTKSIPLKARRRLSAYIKSRYWYTSSLTNGSAQLIIQAPK